MSVPATLRGFRTQYLYTLFVMFHEKDSNTVFIPEGKEDLDIIYADGRKEYIQVKNYSTPVTYSSLISKGKTTSFCKRLLDSRDSEHAKGFIVSYGPISKELTNKKDLRNSIKRHFGKSLRNQDVSWLVDNIECKEIDENFVYDSCTNLIEETFPAMSAEVGIRCLLQWIYECAEKQAQITYNDLVKQVNLVGKFIQDKHSFDTTFGKDIIPCSTIEISTSIDNLQREFYEGVSASYQHVLAKLGVNRELQLAKIDEAFSTSSVAIIHGASGQGKSMLAYQYLQQVIGDAFSYIIPNLNSTNLNAIISSITAFVTNISIPITIYIECNVNDDTWIKFIQLLKGSEKVKILVSIREEEWNICKNRLMQFGSISDIYLNLEETEAKDIFIRLRDTSNIKYHSFEEAWYDYRGGKSLLEFIYLLTHGTSLENRIKSQIEDLIRRGEDDSLILLKYVSLSDVMSGEINIGDLRRLDVVNSDLLEVKLLKLQNEYFIYNDTTKTIKGIHPLRSKFILDTITMNNKEEIIESGLRLYPGIAYKSRKIYLLNLVKEGLSVDTLMKAAKTYQLTDPTIYYPILEVFLWYGIKAYIERNKDIIDKFVQRYHSLWVAMAGLNFTEIDTDESLQTILNPQILHNAFEMRKELSPRQEVFDYALKFLRTYPESFIQSSPEEAEAIGEILVYQSIMNCDSCSMEDKLNLEGCETPQLATLLLGLKSSNVHKNKYVIERIEPIFVKELRTAYNIVSLDISETEITAKSFLDYSPTTQETKTKNSSIIEQHNLDIAELCRRAFPDKKRYTSYLCKDTFISHIASEIPTCKSITRKNLPIDELVGIGSTLGGLIRYEQNPSYSINDYFNKLEEKKHRYYVHINKLTKKFLNYIQYGNKESLSNIAINRDADLTINQIPPLDIPRSNLNIWGLNSKSNPITGSNIDYEDNLVKYNKTVNDFFTAIRLFVNQYFKAMEDILQRIDDSQNTEIATCNIQDAIRHFYELRRMTQAHYKEYIQWTDDEEKSIVCLWLSWFAIVRRNIAQKFNINNSYQNYQRDLYKICEDVKGYVHTELNRQGIDNKVVYADNTIKVWVNCSTLTDFCDCNMKVVETIRNKTSKQSIYSTIFLIESITIKNVDIHPLLVASSGRSMSLNGGFVRFLWSSIAYFDDTFPKPLPCSSIEPKWVENHEGLRLLNACNQVISNLEVTKSQFDDIEIDKLDQSGKEIVWSYLTKIENRVLSYENGSFSKLKEYLAANEDKDWYQVSSVDQLILICDNMIDVIVRVSNHDHSWIKDESLKTLTDDVAALVLNIQIEMVTKS